MNLLQSMNISPMVKRRRFLSLPINGQRELQFQKAFKINVICDTNKFDVVTDGLDEKLKSLTEQKDPLKYEERGTGGGKKKKGLSAGAIAGIVIACVVVVVAVVGVLVWYFVFHKKSVGNSASESA